MLDAARKKLMTVLQKAIPVHWYRGANIKGSPTAEVLMAEKIRTAMQAGRSQVRFLPMADSYTEETAAIRQAYRVMWRDPYIKASLLTKVLAVASLDPQVNPESENPSDKAGAEFVRYNYQKIHGGSRRLIWSIALPAMLEGYSVSEKVWGRLERGKWRNKIWCKALKSKDTKFLELVGDNYRNITAVRDIRSGASYHPSNFVIYSHLPLFESPTGMSDLRAAYKAFWLMDTAWQLRMIALERYGLPVLRGEYPQGDDATKQSLEAALAEVRSQSWFTIPEGSKVEAMDLATKGTADFESAIRDLREEAVLSITGAVLQMLQGQVSDGRGSSAVHKGTAELLQWYLAAEIGGVLDTQLTPDLIDLNFKSDTDYPVTTFGGVDDASMTASLQIDQGLQQMGVELSERELRQRYGRQKPLDETDKVKQPQQGGPGGPGGDGGLGALLGGGPPKDKPPESGSPFSEEVDSFCQEGPNKGKPGPCPDMDSARQKRKAAMGTRKERVAAVAGRVMARKAVRVGQKIDAMIRKAPKGDYLASVVAGNQYIKAAAEKLKQDDARGAGKAVAKEASKALGHTAFETITGWSSALWADLNKTNGPLVATAAGAAFTILNNATFAATVPAMVVPGVNKARYYATYYATRSLAKALANPGKLLARAGKAAKAAGKAILENPIPGVAGFAESALSVDAIVAAVNEIERQMAQKGGFEPKVWTKANVLAALDKVFPDDNQPDMAAAEDPEPPPPPTESPQVAGPHADAKKAEDLLAGAVKKGVDTMSEVMRSAVARMLAAPNPLRAERLFDNAETAKLAETLGDAISTANLLGQSRIFLRAEKAKDAGEDTAKFSEESETPWNCFDEVSSIKPLPPARALSYFKNLVPKIGEIKPERFGPLMQRKAFTLAATTDQTALGRIKEIIQQRIETGQQINATPKAIDAILADAGVTVANPNYSEMVFRTNTMDAYQTGSQEAMRDPEVADIFPVWQYSGIDDGRARPGHRKHFRKYFPSSMSFAEVRDSEKGEFDGFSCRCVSIPVSKYRWKRLQAGGAELAKFSEVINIKPGRLSRLRSLGKRK